MNDDFIFWVIEDTEPIRLGIKDVLFSIYSNSEIKTFNDGESTLNSITGEKKPNLILLDLGLPGMNGKDLLIKLKEKWFDAKILVFTIYDDNEHLFEALKLGACGYILKNEGQEKLIQSIQEALNGGAPMSREIAIKVINSFQKNNQINSIASLSQREIEVLQLLSKGLLYKEIADKLNVAQNTIKNHLQSIYIKLHVTNRSEAIIEYLNSKK